MSEIIYNECWFLYTKIMKIIKKGRLWLETRNKKWMRNRCSSFKNWTLISWFCVTIISFFIFIMIIIHFYFKHLHHSSANSNYCKNSISLVSVSFNHLFSILDHASSSSLYDFMASCFLPPFCFSNLHQRSLEKIKHNFTWEKWNRNDVFFLSDLIVNLYPILPKNPILFHILSYLI